MSYFLISVSNKINLDLCIKYSLAGFTNSINGLWTFVEIQENDFISFLYGARVFNLYKVVEKKAFIGAERLPPWPSVTFRMSGKTYYFPFRLFLEPIRKFEESMVKPEFSYVAENLLLRGGYRKTHFQADQTTLQAVSQLGNRYTDRVEPFRINQTEIFIPKFTWDKSKVSNPEIFKFQEFILQAIIRQYLKDNLQKVFSLVGLDQLKAENFEILGEKALPEGHIDILIKESIPMGLSGKIVLEAKQGNAKIQDINQLSNYMKEIGEECLGGILICEKFSVQILNVARNKNIKLLIYDFKNINKGDIYSFSELMKKFSLKN